MSLYHTSCADGRSQLDEAAEREGAAAEWFAENLGQSEPIRPHVRMADLVAMAESLGVDPPRPPRYPRGAAVKLWLRIVDAIGKGEAVPASVLYSLPSTRAGRAQHQREYRQRRAGGLNVLATTPADEPLPIRRAAELSGMSLSGFEKVLSRGAVPRLKVGRGAYVRAGDLAAHLRQRLRLAA